MSSATGRMALAGLVAGVAAIVSVVAGEQAKPAPSSSTATAPATPKDGWPDTPAGAAARRWVAAFSKGEEAMRACILEIQAPETLRTRGIEERMTTYRENHERFGTLTLAAIEKSAPDEVEATLLAADLTKHRFVFKVEPDAPHRLLSVGRIETRMGHGGFSH